MASVCMNIYISCMHNNNRYKEGTEQSVVCFCTVSGHINELRVKTVFLKVERTQI